MYKPFISSICPAAKKAADRQMGFLKLAIRHGFYNVCDVLLPRTNLFCLKYITAYSFVKDAALLLNKWD